jgi:sortase B
MTSLLVMTLAGAALLADYRETRKERSEFTQLILLADAQETNQDIIAEAAELDAVLNETTICSAPEEGDLIETLTTEPETPIIRGDLAALYEMNGDLGGWIRIDGTVIDYPVMFTPSEPQKYLHLSFHGEKSSRGVPFIGEGCTIYPRSDNIVLYGHHMKSGDMFAAIVRYKNIAFWREHPIIHFSTLYQQDDYEVFAVLETNIDAAESIRCYSFTNAQSEEDFNNYIIDIKTASLYDTGISVSYGDEILTLSTCAYHTDNGRFVIIAKRK